MIPASAPKIMNRTPATFRLALQSMGFNDIPLFIITKPAKDIAVGALPIDALDLGRIGCPTKQCAELVDAFVDVYAGLAHGELRRLDVRRVI
jgi:hypothetical protein